MKPNFITFVRKGAAQVLKYGPGLLYWRYLRRRGILRAEPLRCDPEAALEVHTQVCARDWLNCLWSIRSFAHFVPGPFRLVVQIDRTVDAKTEAVLRRHFPGAIFQPVEPVPAAVTAFFAERYPALYALRCDPAYSTMPKVTDSYLLRRNGTIVTIDPDILFFASPTELLNGIPAGAPYFSALNLPKFPTDPKGAYCVEADELGAKFGISFPISFQFGLGLLDYSKWDWDRIEEIARGLTFDRNRGLLTDQTLFAIMSVLAGQNPLPIDRYAVAPVPSLEGVVARHYYGHTRDLLYKEGIPALIRKGIVS